MNAVRKYTTIADSGILTLENLPFERGEQVEVLVFSHSSTKENIKEKWMSSFRSVQDNPASKLISEEEIQEEITNYRLGK